MKPLKMLIARNWIRLQSGRWEYRSDKMDEGIGGEERRQKSTVTRREPDNTMT